MPQFCLRICSLVFSKSCCNFFLVAIASESTTFMRTDRVVSRNLNLFVVLEPTDDVSAAVADADEAATSSMPAKKCCTRGPAASVARCNADLGRVCVCVAG